MKARASSGRSGSTKGGEAPSDLLVCFPSRAHLSMIPKAICSPSGRINTTKLQLSKPIPLFIRTKPKSFFPETSEPTSPKVTCAGQIKVRPIAARSTGKNWLSMVEEMEGGRVRPRRKKLRIVEDILQFLNALRGLRCDMRCFGFGFGSSHGSVECETDDEVCEDKEEEDEGEDESSASGAIVRKWFMLLEEKQLNRMKKEAEDGGEVVAASSSVPPQDAFLLTRCRSAPARGWLGGNGEESGGGGGGEVNGKNMTQFLMRDASFSSVDSLTRSRSWRA